MIAQNNEIRFETCTFCQNVCKLCCHSKMRRNKEVMDKNMFQKYLNNIMDCSTRYKHVNFSGIGEPLLDPSLLKHIGYARHHRFECSVVTNGRLLTPEMFSMLQDGGVSYIRVSILGLHQYGKAHGCPDVIKDRVLENLRYALLNKKDTEIYINCVASSKEEAVDMIATFSEFDRLEIWKAHNWGTGQKNRKVQKNPVNNCGRIFNGPLQVLVNGDVTVCCMDYDGKLSLGNLGETSLKDIFKSEEYVNQVVCSTTGVWDKKYPCYKCDQRNPDKSDVLAYSSLDMPIGERVKFTSTAIQKLGDNEG